MEFKKIILGNIEISHLIDQNFLIKDESVALDVMGNAPTPFILVSEANFPAEFFELRSGLLGAILQKFSNYGVRLAIIGNFKKYKSKAFSDYIWESNRHGDFLFVENEKEIGKYWKTT